MSDLYWPTTHELVVLDRLLLDWSTALSEVESALAWLTPHISKSDIADLRAQLDRTRRQWQSPPIHARCPVVPGLGRNLRLATGEPILRVRFRAYQEGGALLLHTTWLWDGQADAELFARKIRPLLQAPHFGQGELGVAYLWTAAVAEGYPTADEVNLVRAILGPTGGSTQRWPVRVSGVALFADPLHHLDEVRLQDVALFDSPRVTKSLAVSHLTLVEWPLWSLARLRLRHLYLAEHRPRLLSAFKPASEKLASALGRTIGQRDRGQPILLVRPRLGKLQEALITLSGPQYQMLELLADAEERLRAGHLELGNLERSIARAVGALLAQTGEAKPAELRAELDEVLTGHLRRDVAQMDADLLPFRHLAERATRSVEVLATQADILEAGYERQLSLRMGVVGTALAAGEIVSETAAKVIYEWVIDCPGMGRVQEALGLPVVVEVDDPVILGVRFFIILLSGLLAWLLLRRHLDVIRTARGK